VTNAFGEFVKKHTQEAALQIFEPANVCALFKSSTIHTGQCAGRLANLLSAWGTHPIGTLYNSLLRLLTLQLRVCLFKIVELEELDPKYNNTLSDYK
jgi:hypothetical protein